MSPMTASYSPDEFTRTRWSMVHDLRDGRVDHARDALTELAVRYWYPVYAYVRRCGHSQEIAQDIAQAFLHQVAGELRDERGHFSGRFREWLLARLNTFLAGEWRELAEGGQVSGAPQVAEMEARSRTEHAADESPELAYRRSFAMEVLMRGLRRLRSEAGQAGHAAMCDALEPFLTREPAAGQYEELSRTLGLRPLVLVMALKRLRQRYRELVRQELIDTVASADDLAAEQQALFAVLGQRD